VKHLPNGEIGKAARGLKKWPGKKKENTTRVKELEKGNSTKGEGPERKSAWRPQGGRGEGGKTGLSGKNLGEHNTGMKEEGR